jgi:hypothetical protein
VNGLRLQLLKMAASQAHADERSAVA